MCNKNLCLVNFADEDSRECLDVSDGDYTIFEVYFRIKDKLVMGVTCNCLRHITEFVNSPNFVMEALKKSIYGVHINKLQLVFKDGKTLCYHCKYFIDHLKNICRNDQCVPDITYI
jgi:hypothetical protein